VIVLPELCSSGYMFATREEAFGLAEEIPEGPACRAWMDAARRHGCYIAAGLAERVGQKLFNASVLVGPDGHIGTFRKCTVGRREPLLRAR
jgi:predicted amidohydrolase